MDRAAGVRLGEWLLAETNRRNVSLRAAAAEMGVSHGTLSRIARGLAPDLATLCRLARWADTAPGDLLELAGVAGGDAAERTWMRRLRDEPDLRAIVELAAALPAGLRAELKRFALFLASEAVSREEPDRQH